MSGSAAAAELAALAAGLDGTATLVWKRLRRGIYYVARLERSGRIVLSDGRVFRDPSEAARAVHGTLDVDGWRAWHLGEDGPSLAEMRGL